MRIRHDPDADAVYVTFANEPSEYTQLIDDHRFVDYAGSGAIIGVEFLDVSAGIRVEGLPVRTDTLAEELRRAKDHLKGSFMLGLESTSSRMGNLARQELYFKRFFSLDDMVESIEKVTAEEVQRLAREFFDAKNITLTVLGNLGEFKMKREELAC